MFKPIGKFFEATATFFTTAGKAAESLGHSIEENNKASEMRLAKKIEEYKKEKAQIVIDGGYESEEAMDEEHKEIISSLKRRDK